MKVKAKIIIFNRNRNRDSNVVDLETRECNDAMDYHRDHYLQLAKHLAEALNIDFLSSPSPFTSKREHVRPQSSPSATKSSSNPSLHGVYLK